MTADKGGYKHFMLKEIFEQPRAIRDTISKRISLDSGKVLLDPMNISESEFRNFTGVKILGCGASWHAGLAGKFMIERLARIPVEVDYADEFRYRDPIVGKNALCICISQSGETADTIGALREANRKGAKTLAICNVPGSTMTREATGAVVTDAGPEISVATTKAFTAELAVLALIALYLGQVHERITADRARAHMQELMRIPMKMETILESEGTGIYDELARHLGMYSDFLYLGRGIHFPIALEGALNLKEISYIHSEGYPAGEMKHGPNALIDNKLPVVFVATRDENDPESLIRYEKTVSNIQEVKARDGIVMTIATEGDQLARAASDYMIEVPMSPDLFSPMVEVIPLQLLAYHIAVRLGRDVDQPRNLAKSVTAE
ncbi:MAG TPA: glutamine--fructose-6-phosphate transaminase (isomerizing) [Candidatus Acidoferrales bacterium]|jgi:glucosamine--fructose-6-phosphate aminotransferase (isomerizing)|nr:glutamine--fructose-6-phosphate transaminase (isomerizing) [Candidatus Acidoferrales bacterium]